MLRLAYDSRLDGITTAMSIIDDITSQIGHRIAYVSSALSLILFSEKLVRGEIGPHESFPQTRLLYLRPGKSLAFSHAPFRQDFNDTNRTLCTPSLCAGIEGDLNARSVYERSRLLHYSTLSEWGRACVDKEVFKIYARVAGTTIPVSSDGGRTVIYRARQMLKPEDMADHLLLNGIISYASGRALERRIEKLNFDPGRPLESIRTADSQYEVVFNYGLLDHGPLGANAREAFPVALDRMLRVAIVDDLIHFSGIDISPTVRRKIADHGKTAWDVIKSPFLTRIKEILALFENEKRMVTAAQRSEIVKHLLDSPTLSRDYEYYFQRVTGQSQPRTSATQTEPVPVRDQGERTTDFLSGVGYREAFIAGVLKSIENSGARPERPRAVAKKLFALFKRGAISYEEIVSSLSERIDPYEIADRAHDKLREKFADSDPTISAARPADEMPRRPAAASPDTGDDLIRLSCAEPRNRNPFHEWLDSLSAESRTRVERRLLRMECGNLGDHKPLALGGKGIMEARIHNPPLRIYFVRVGNDRIVLLHGGEKATQTADIGKAAEIWASWLNEQCPGRA